MWRAGARVSRVHREVGGGGHRARPVDVVRVRTPRGLAVRGRAAARSNRQLNGIRQVCRPPCVYVTVTVTDQLSYVLITRSYHRQTRSSGYRS